LARRRKLRVDAYDRTARLYPALLVAAPFTLFALTLLSLPDAWQKAASLIAAGGLHVLLIQWVRDRGLSAQKTLWADWGGPPTTRMLRWSNATNLTLQTRRHEDVGKATGVPLPTAEEEAADPESADDCYETAVTVLRQRTRSGDDYPLVQAENAHYGFRRNLYGCKPLGIGFAATAAAIEIALVILSWLGVVDLPPGWLLLAALLSGAAIVAWRKWITPGFVETAANKYAEELLSAASTVPAE
jgi:hypothetical protein